MAPDSGRLSDLGSAVNCTERRSNIVRRDELAGRAQGVALGGVKIFLGRFEAAQRNDTKARSWAPDRLGLEPMANGRPRPSPQRQADEKELRFP
jgi:hypothetical protein